MPSTDQAAEPLARGETVERLGRDAIRKLIDEHYRFIWRLLARLGVQAGNVDDATQQVFMVLMTRENTILQPGRERSFLFGVAVRVAREHRRRDKKHETQSEADFESFADPGVDIEALSDQQRARELLDRIVGTMPEELRMVFILFEIEGLAAVDVAGVLGIPPGTVASRLRRARQHFRAQVQALNIPGALKGLR